VAQLLDSQKSKVLLPDLQEAKSFWARAKGLIGQKQVAEGYGLWFDRTNSIHTCFMQVSIDCVFLDKQMRVKAIYADVKPWRLVPPVWGARSVLEMKSGQAQALQIQVGDQLYVGH